MNRKTDMMIWSMGVAVIMLAVWGFTGFVSMMNHKTDIHMMARDIELKLQAYYTKHGNYPDSLSELKLNEDSVEKEAVVLEYKSYGDSFTFRIPKEEVQFGGREGKQATFSVTDVDVSN